jgi:hypothetical protein
MSSLLSSLLHTRPVLGQEVPVAHAYAKGKTHNAVSLPAGNIASADLTTTGYDTLTVLWRMTGGAAGDLTGWVVPYEDDGTTVWSNGNVLPNETTTAAALAGGVVYLVRTYKLRGIDKVAVRAQNNNVGAQTLTAIYFLQK